MLFPSSRAAQRCVEFLLSKDKTKFRADFKILNLGLDSYYNSQETLRWISPSISAVLLDVAIFALAKEYWQNTGDGISSRHAEFCHHLFQEGILIENSCFKPCPEKYQKVCKGLKRYQKEGNGNRAANAFMTRLSKGLKLDTPSKYDSEDHEISQFLEERFGRNLDISHVELAKSAIRRRIAGSLDTEDKFVTNKPQTIQDSRPGARIGEKDVYLWSCGMNSIFQTHQMLMEARGAMKSICFGFPYIDTLKILQKFGPGCIFYGEGSSEDLDDLEKRLIAGEKYLALFCEFPSNPLLKSPELLRIRGLAKRYDFVVVIDETIGNYINVNVLPYADVLVSSLTKIFSGDCNVMGGSSILNPNSRYYSSLKRVVERDFEDNYWAEDAIFMERNSRDFIKRIERINENTEAICSILQVHPCVQHVYYPKCNSTRANYDACRTLNGRYGGLLSILFKKPQQAITFHDKLDLHKGPSLGTNFTLVSPYVILAYYSELEWAAQLGVPKDLIRISVGLEDQKDLISKFGVALNAVVEQEMKTL